MSVMTMEAPLFSDVTRRRKSLPVSIILLAVLLHLMLLGIPGGQKPASTPPLEVSLQFEPPPAKPLPEPQRLPVAPPEQVTDPAPELVREEVPASPPEKTGESPAETTSPPAPEADPAPKLVREQLLEAVARMDWTIPEAESSLRRTTSSETLNRLYRPMLPLVENAFDGMTAPSEVEVVDRWLDPNGTQQVVIRSPDGKTYCGRQAAADPFRPWLQMPMLFHSCGGGGKRSGTPGWRNN